MRSLLKSIVIMSLCILQFDAENVYALSSDEVVLNSNKNQNETIVKKQLKAAGDEWLEHWKNGPKRLRWQQQPVQVGDPAPNFSLLDSTGQRVSLEDFWSEKPTLLIFWRHYGCGCGVERAERLREEYDSLTKQGVNIVIIGQAEPERSAQYAERNQITNAVLSDPDYKVYTAYGLLDGDISQVLYGGPKLSYEDGVELMKSRFDTDRALVDNPWLLPGEFLIDKQGVIRFVYRYQYCSNIPDTEVIKTAISTLKEIPTL